MCDLACTQTASGFTISVLVLESPPLFSTQIRVGGIAFQQYCLYAQEYMLLKFKLHNLRFTQGHPGQMTFVHLVLLPKQKPQTAAKYFDGRGEEVTRMQKYLSSVLGVALLAPGKKSGYNPLTIPFKLS